MEIADTRSLRTGLLDQKHPTFFIEFKSREIKPESKINLTFEFFSWWRWRGYHGLSVVATNPPSFGTGVPWGLLIGETPSPTPTWRGRGWSMRWGGWSYGTCRNYSGSGRWAIVHRGGSRKRLPGWGPATNSSRRGKRRGPCGRDYNRTPGCDIGNSWCLKYLKKRN